MSTILNLQKKETDFLKEYKKFDILKKNKWENESTGLIWCLPGSEITTNRKNKLVE